MALLMMFLVLVAAVFVVRVTQALASRAGRSSR